MLPAASSTRAEAVLEGLDAEQRAAATALSGPVCILAGAGTGKTRAITHRIAYGVHTGAFDPRRVLAVTFTTRASGELKGRLRGLGVEGVSARTFHSAALRQARFFWPQAVGRDLPAILGSKLGLVRSAAARVRAGNEPTVMRDLASEIEWAKVSNVGPESYAGAAAAAVRLVAGLELEAVGRVYAAYEELKEDRGVIDFEDVLLAAVSLLDAHPGIAEQVRAQYRHFVVDEYQDVSPLQEQLLDLWLGDRSEVCVVGDPNQTIYSFAGAKPDYLLGFPQRFPGATLVRLVRDYRSTPQVVEVANRILAGARGPAARHRVELQAQRTAGPAARFVEHPDEVAEAEAVARQIRSLVDGGTPPREIAVLYRVNAQSEAYEQALADVGVPYLVRGAERFFDRPEVRQAAMVLRGAARSEQSDAPLPELVRAVLSGLGWSAEPPSVTGAARERWESLAALIALADDLVAANPHAGLPELNAELEARAAAQHAPAADGVTLASLHATKGLEWEAVYLVGCQDGTLPISFAETSEEIEEERRLFYVGVTRAGLRLSISWSLARTPGGRASRRPSRFLVGVRPSSATGAAAEARGQRAAAARRAGMIVHCRVCGRPVATAAERKVGRCATCPPSYDEGLFEALRSWRLGQAQQQGVPAYVVFTDATLTAIAETRPGDRAALARISGVGATKLERYGEAVLKVCAEIPKK